MVQNDETGQDAEVHNEGGRWVTLKEAATHLGVSVDTVKRRMQRGELEVRREAIPQGFRWLVRIDPAKTEVTEAPVRDENGNRGVQVPSPDVDVVAALLNELQVRNREIASLHATVAALIQAVEQLKQLPAGEIDPAVEVGTESLSKQADSPPSEQMMDVVYDNSNHRVADTSNFIPLVLEASKRLETEPRPSGWAGLRRWWSGKA